MGIGESMRCGLTKAALLMIAVGFCNGCSTIYAKYEDGSGHPFVGTRNAVSGVGCSLAYIGFFGVGLLMLPFALIDVPFSFVADLIVLPADLTKKDPKPETSHTCA